ncbi:Ldh family oxidoreductase [Pukyongiella litopenaei]|uniref:Ldh family oxidoreductase n=1 Tax=Pukyongiella litopenaei TaxID=2605946 RepID=A0A2S0MRI2_9RHOB|nr:Ldh family oxidoreductase [Pukyongiella litopenaei]AVO38437.1 Ldh family oxidoreductase [Pukyongiella litopenaei]
MIAAVDAVDRLSSALGGGPAARLAASALIEADALGQPRFGIAMLGEWTPDLRPPQMGADMQALRWLDCSGRFAPLAVATATLDLAAAARRFGVAAVFLRGVRGFGRLAPFVRHLADAGLAGLAGAEGPPFVAAHGGTRPVIGTNPLAFAIGQGADRVVIDAATSSCTMADIREARADGSPLPEGIALDGQGRPTRVAAEVAALLPRGGQVGSLLGLVVELMAGVAGGGRGDPAGRGVFLVAFDPDAAGRETDWRSGLAGLRRDWTGGGGYWPRGGGLPPDAALDADFERRLDGYLAAMRGTEDR